MILTSLQTQRSTGKPTDDILDPSILQESIAEASPERTMSTIWRQTRLGLDILRQSHTEHGPLSIITTESVLDSESKDVVSTLPTVDTPTSSRRKWEAWQNLVSLNLILVTLALICNIGVLIWALYKPVGSFDSTRLLYEGNCSRTKSIDFWAHMGINILSTAILAGGNYATQILVAPTRRAVDCAHQQGRSLAIGVQSFKNWNFLGTWPKVLISVLLITTCPLHTVYNSTIYSTISSIAVRAAPVTNDFLTVPSAHLWQHWPNIRPVDYIADMYVYGPGFEEEISSANNSIFQSLFDLAKDEAFHGNLTSFDNLTRDDCWNALTGTFVSDYSAVLYFVDLPSSIYNASILSEGIANYGWLDLYVPFAPSSPTTWSFTVNDGNGHTNMANVTHCLAFKAESFCTVELVPTFLVTVVVCNLVKALVLLNLLCLSFHPLKTIGDAIASFLELPEPITVERRVVGMKAIRDGKRRRRYFFGASKAYWIWVIVLCVLYWLFELGAEFLCNNSFSQTGTPLTLSQQWKDGFGALETQTINPVTLDFFSSVIAINLPQLWLSFIYVFYNALLTDLLVLREWLSYSVEPKGLRVTKAVGEQRPAYFLSLPFRFSVPLAGFMAMLHWMLSQSLYLGQVNVYFLGPQLELQHLQHGSQYLCAYSSLGIMLSLIIGGILILAILILGFCRYKPGIHLVQGDSKAISAACHPMEGDRDSTKKVQYGILAVLGNDTYHVGFSSGPVLSIANVDICPA